MAKGEWTAHDTQGMTCGNPLCQLDLEMEPLLGPPEDYRRLGIPHRFYYGNTDSQRARIAWTNHASRHRNSMLYRMPRVTAGQADVTEVVLELIKLRFDEAAWYVDNQWLGQDRRASGDTYKRDEAVWHPFSRVTSALKAIGGHPALTVSCELPDETPAFVFLKELAHGDRTILDALGYVMIWRCGCSGAHEVRYRTLEDLPTTYGYHDSCILCNASPIEVAPRSNDRPKHEDPRPSAKR
jgi:hypothetical protein